MHKGLVFLSMSEELKDFKMLHWEKAMVRNKENLCGCPWSEGLEFSAVTASKEFQLEVSGRNS